MTSKVRTEDSLPSSSHLWLGDDEKDNYFLVEKKNERDYLDGYENLYGLISSSGIDSNGSYAHAPMCWYNYK